MCSSDGKLVCECTGFGAGWDSLVRALRILWPAPFCLNHFCRSNLNCWLAAVYGGVANCWFTFSHAMHECMAFLHASYYKSDAMQHHTNSSASGFHFLQTSLLPVRQITKGFMQIDLVSILPFLFIQTLKIENAPTYMQDHSLVILLHILC